MASAAYQMGPGGTHSAADWQRYFIPRNHPPHDVGVCHSLMTPCRVAVSPRVSENRAQMERDHGPRNRRGGRKLFGDVGPEAALPGSDRAARAAVERARRVEAQVGAGAVIGVAPGAGHLRVAPGPRALGRPGGPNSLLSGIGAAIASDPGM